MLIKTPPKLLPSPSAAAAAAVCIQRTCNIHVDQPSFLYFAASRPKVCRNPLLPPKK